jgi:hypothetical protein
MVSGIIGAGRRGSTEARIVSQWATVALGCDRRIPSTSAGGNVGESPCATASAVGVMRVFSAGLIEVSRRFAESSMLPRGARRRGEPAGNRCTGTRGGTRPPRRVAGLRPGRRPFLDVGVEIGADDHAAVTRDPGSAPSLQIAAQTSQRLDEPVPDAHGSRLMMPSPDEGERVRRLEILRVEARVDAPDRARVSRTGGR